MEKRTSIQQRTCTQNKNVVIGKTNAVIGFLRSSNDNFKKYTTIYIDKSIPRVYKSAPLEFQKPLVFQEIYG